jgi:hypothetical protein
MKKIKVQFKTREEALFPYLGIPIKERLIASGAVDLRENHTIHDMGNGYIQIRAIDKTKLIK